MSDLQGTIEGMLFAWGDPLEVKEIAEVLQVTRQDVELALAQLEAEYMRPGRGLRLCRRGEGVSLSTKPEDYESIEPLFVTSKKRDFTKASLETLAIIAYRQPITRVDVEDIRGVGCERLMRALLDAGFIEECGRLDRPGKPKLYRTTSLFLETFGLESLSALPPLEEAEETEVLNFLENSL